MHIAMHAFGKITLFFCAGAIMVGAHKTEISTMRGLGLRMPFTMAAFFVGSLSVIGVPPMGGSWSKWFLALAAADSGHKIMVGVLMLSSLLSIAYLMPVVARAFFSRPSDDDGHGTVGIKEAPLLCVIPPVFTALCCIVLFFCADSIEHLLRGMKLS
jgi:multicomponent Na+:H+ antiporter subunit D